MNWTEIVQNVEQKDKEMGKKKEITVYRTKNEV